MRRDPLTVSLKLRSLAVNAAKVALANALEDEQICAAKVAEIALAMRHEAERASALSAGDVVVEAFAVWLREARGRQRLADEKLATAEAVTSQARAALMIARSAEAAVELLIETRTTAERQRTERQAQTMIDELAARPHAVQKRSLRKRGA